MNQLQHVAPPQHSHRVLTHPLATNASTRRAAPPPLPRTPADAEPARVVGTIRRNLPRHDLELAIDFTIAGQRHSSTTRMLSLGGAFIASELRPAFNTRLAARFVLPELGTAIEVGGVVRWSDARGFGVQFDGLRAGAVWALGKFFEARRKHGAA